MPSPFHSREKLFNAGVNHRPTFIRAGEFLYCLHGIVSQQGNELHLVAVLAIKQFRAVISGDVSRSDTRENFAAQHRLIRLCICWFGPAVPDPRDHSHPHDLITAIDVNDLTGDRCGSVAREKHSGPAEFRRVATAFQRCAFLIVL
jgi:hypothetical protein